MTQHNGIFNYFLRRAKILSLKSKDPSTKIGAIIVNPFFNATISEGYNGFPRRVSDSAARLTDRPTKYLLTVHAETNAIFNAARVGMKTLGADIYVSGLPPCSECSKAIIQAGINRVISYDIEIPDRWQESINLGRKLFEEAGVEMILIEKVNEDFVY